MIQKRRSPAICLVIVTATLLLFVILSTHSVVHANGQNPTPNNGNCISCHEDLYFLHDTGNWFCLKESPMSCVDCHGGDPSAQTKKLAHVDRAAHPVINEDISKCQECHPQECAERLQIFDETAGISDVLVAHPYQPMIIPVTAQSLDEPKSASAEHIKWFSSMEMIVPLLFISIAIIVYTVRRKHQQETGKIHK